MMNKVELAAYLYDEDRDFKQIERLAENLTLGLLAVLTYKRNYKAFHALALLYVSYNLSVR